MYTILYWSGVGLFQWNPVYVRLATLFLPWYARAVANLWRKLSLVGSSSHIHHPHLSTVGPALTSSRGAGLLPAHGSVASRRPLNLKAVIHRQGVLVQNTYRVNARLMMPISLRSFQDFLKRFSDCESKKIFFVTVTSFSCLLSSSLRGTELWTLVTEDYFKYRNFSNWSLKSFLMFHNLWSTWISSVD